MQRLQKIALLTRLVGRLQEQGSWCGETHIQKSTLFLQDLFGISLNFEFIIYKHGPFSFDLREELTSLLADELLKIKPEWPYGAHYLPTDRCETIQSLFRESLKMQDKGIAFIAQQLGRCGVAELERIGTAFYIQHRTASESPQDLVKQLRELKPHIDQSDAITAVERVNQIINEARRIQSATG